MKSAFSQRHGLNPKSTAVNDFPIGARNALMFILQRFVDEGLVRKTDDGRSWRPIYAELLRTVGADGKLPELADEKLPVPVQY